MTRSIYRGALGIVGVFVAVVVLAACGGSSSSSSSASSSGGSSSSGSSSSGSAGSGAKPGKGKPPITLGDKNFTEEYILGDMYQQALQAKGYTVTLKANIGSSEVVDKALTSGQIDMYPEYTGVILSVLAGKDIHPTSAAQTYNMAKAFEQHRGFTLLTPTPFFDADAIVTLKPFATKNGLHTIADLKKLPSWTYGGPPENKTRYEGVAGLHQAYGLNNVKFVPLAIGLQYTALDNGSVQTAAAFTTDGQLESGKYVVLTDTKHIFGFQNVAPVVSPKLVAREGPAFAQTLNAVDAKLTNTVMQKLNAAVQLQKVDPATVAQTFLKDNGLL